MIGPSELYPKTFQVGLVAHVARSPIFRANAMSSIMQEDFDQPEVRAVFAAVTSVIASSGDRAQTSADEITSDLVMHRLAAMIRSGEIHPSEIDMVAEVLDMIYRVDLSPMFYIGQMKGFLEHQRVRRVFNTAILDPAGFSSANFHRSVANAYESAGVATGFSDVSPVDIMDRALSDRSDDVVPTGIHSIDVALGGGHLKRKTAMVCAYTGVGKTTLCLNFMRNAAMEGREARFITLELPEDEVAKRWLSLVTGYPFGLLMKGDPSGRKTRAQIKDEAMGMLHQKMRDEPRFREEVGRFRIWDMSTEVCTAEMIRQKIMMDAAAGRKPDTVAIDWLDIMGLPPGQGREMEVATKENRQRLFRIVKTLDDMAKEREIDVALWIATQANGDAEGKAKVGLSANSESKAKAQPVSIFMGVGTTPADKERGIYTVHVPKYRDGAVFDTKIYGNLGRQLFTDYNEELESCQMMTPSAIAARAARVESSPLSASDGQFGDPQDLL